MFANRNDIDVLAAPKAPRRFLILIRAGSNPRPTFFETAPPPIRNCDIGMNYYDTPHANDVMSEAADLICAGGLSKWHGASLLMRASDLLYRYEGVLFLDEDLELLFDPDDFFAVCHEYGLHLAQPSLTHDSASGFPVTMRHPCLKMRTTNWVEIMGPYMKQDFLREMAHSFDLSISGFGLDVYWGCHLGALRTAAIVDEFAMRHTKALDYVNGGFYKYLNSIGVNQHEEMRRMFAKLGIKEFTVQVTDYIPYDFNLIFRVVD